MNATQGKTCADLIAGELKDREDQLKELYQMIDLDSDDARDDLNSMAYGIDRLEVIRVIWSGGGPADHLEITTSGGEIVKVEYVYQDWYDGARLTVQEDSPAYRYANEILEGLI
jgi:hypothetical protein